MDQIGSTDHSADADRPATASADQLPAETLLRRQSMGPAPKMPDLSRTVVKANARADRRSRRIELRLLLALVAIEVAVLSVRDLITYAGDASTVHTARHLGAFSLAYAVALAVVVVRPARARSILPVSFVLAGALMITAVIDVVNGHIPLIGEATHLPELLSVGLLWLLAKPLPDPTPGVEPAPLRLVDDADDDQPRRRAG